MPTYRRTLLNAFVQVNTIKGFRFLDDSGRIVNEYFEEFPTRRIINDETGVMTLEMINELSKVRQVRVSSERIWLNFDEPDTPAYIMDLSTKFIQKICEILDVRALSRMGARFQYVYSDADTLAFVRRARRSIFSQAMNEYFHFAEPGGNPDERGGFQLSIPFASGDLEASLHLAAVEPVPNAQLPPGFPDHGLLVDIDLYRTGEFSVSEFRRFLRGVTHWVSEDLGVMMAALIKEE